jgi:L-asparagine transporter-like permease
VAAVSKRNPADEFVTVQEQSPPADTERTEQGAPGAADEGPELKKSLKSRHMTMISLGGVIGAGLFVGSSAVIAADVMNAIVVTAVLSCLNSGMYTGSRMLFALARRGDAPKGLLDVNRRGVPVKAILLTSSIGFASTALAYISPDKVFLFLVTRPARSRSSSTC